MRQHLSDKQFTKYIAGEMSAEAQRHLAECSRCNAELDRFGTSVAEFRTALRNRVEVRAKLQAVPFAQPVIPADPRWRWALVAATALVLSIIPFAGIGRYTAPLSVQTTQSDADADALMRAVELDLSRTLPEPLEPVIALFPTVEMPTESGGVQ